MSIASENARVQYTLTGSGQTLAVPFYFLAAADLEVVKTSTAGADTTLVLTTDYTVSGVGNPVGGSVTMVAGAAGEVVTIARAVPFTQDTELAYLSQQPAATLERAYDRLVMQVQRLSLAVKRTLRIPVSNAEVAEMSLNARKGKTLQFNGTTGALELTDSADSAAAAAGASAAAAAGSANSASASADDAETAQTAAEAAAALAYANAAAANVALAGFARVAAVSNVASLAGLPVVDDLQLVAGDVILLTAQSTGAQNGPWVVGAGSWTRPAWYADGNASQAAFGHGIEVNGLGVGTGGSSWRLLTSGTITVGTTATTWARTPELVRKVDTSFLEIAWWGDSLTAGSGGEPPTLPLSAYSGMAVFNGGVGGENSTQIRTRMVAATSRYSNMVIIWAGRNNYNSPTTVKADIAAMVAACGHTRYLVLGVTNNSSEGTGTAALATIKQLNTDLAAIYGARFIDMRAFLLNDALGVLGISPTAGDLADIANEVIPGSIRSDATHFNTNGGIAIASKVYSVWFQDAVAAKMMGYMLANYGEIGGIKRGRLRTSALYVGNRLFDNAGNGEVRLHGSFLPGVNSNLVSGTGYDIGSPGVLDWNDIWARALFLNGNLSGNTLVIRTTRNGGAGGGVMITKASDNAEKWRFGLRDMGSGTEGNDLLFAFFDGSSRATRVRFLAAGGLQLDNVTYRSGSGSPNSVVTGSVGDIYTSMAGGAGTTLYVKESGNNTNTGWVAK